MGGAPSNLVAQHPGGQVTATLSFLDHCEGAGYRVDTIDTSQVSFPKPSLYRRFSKSISRLARLLKLLVLNNYKGSVIFSSSGFSVFEKSFMCLICRAFNVKSILFIRSGHFIEECEGSVLLRTLLKSVLAWPSYLGAQGLRWVQLYLEAGIPESKIKLVRNWVESDFKIADNPRSSHKGALTFIFVGWVVEKKGVRDLVEAFSNSFLLKFCDLRIVGAGDLLPSLKKYCNLNKADNVTFYGWQESREVDELLKSSDVFVLPTYAEGFPNSLLEAMCIGLPVITTPVGAIPDSVKDNVNGFLVEPGNRKQLRLSMEEFLANPGLIKKFSTANLRSVREKHSHAQNCDALLSLFN